MQLTAEQEQAFEGHIEAKVNDSSDQMMDEIEASPEAMKAIHAILNSYKPSFRQREEMSTELFYALINVREKELQHFLLDRNELDGDSFQ